NAGFSNITITNVTILGALAGQFAIGGRFPKTIPPGGSDSINVFLNPTVTNNNINATLRINANDPEGIFTAQLSGRSAGIGWVLKGPLNPLNTNENAVAVQMLTANFGYGLTANDLYKTTNGGASWIKMNVIAPGVLRTMFWVTTNAG